MDCWRTTRGRKVIEEEQTVGQCGGEDGSVAGKTRRLSGFGSTGLRVALSALFALIAVAIAYRPLEQLISDGRSDYYSHVVLIPFVSAYFLYLERRRIVGSPLAFGWKTAGPLATIAIAGYVLAYWQRDRLGSNDFASVVTAASVVLLWAGFVLAFGREAFRAARFPLLFLLFSIPVPFPLLDRFIYVLQVGSTEVTQRLFDLTFTPYSREGFVYHFSTISIEIARECSGIRSSLALLITGVLAGHLFLRSGWKTAVLLIAMIPVTILKNGIRILTLSLLAIHVDTKFITDSFLHHSGGFIFYIPGLLMMGLVIWVLRKVRPAQSKEVLRTSVEDKRLRRKK
jgi:exosortase